MWTITEWEAEFLNNSGELIKALELASEALQDAATFGGAPAGYWDKGGAGHDANIKCLDVLAKVKAIKQEEEES